MRRGIVVGTGPSLRSVIGELWRFDGLLFACNNTPADLLEHGVKESRIIWLACDPAWHAHYGFMPGNFAKWHWDAGICAAYGYEYVEGVWHEGKRGPMRLWLKDKSKITLGHCSSVQLLNLALNQYECSEAILIGHDMRYPPNQPRHYFSGLSSDDGEYPQAIRKHSDFDKRGRDYDLLTVYEELAETEGMPTVYNATPDSALKAFPFRDFEEFLT